MFYQVKNFIRKTNMSVNLKDNYLKILQTMKFYQTSQIFVVDDNQKLCGVISEDDLLKIKKNKNSSCNKTAKQILSNNINFVSVYPENNMTDVLKVMREMNFKYIPVCKSVTDKSFIGIIKNKKIS